ncbi:hypothetical protein ES703_65273 [subsurface metagenome]
MSVMATQTIDFQLTGNKPAHNLVGIIAFKFSHPAAGHMPAKKLGKFPGCQAELLRPEGSRPGTIRKGKLCSNTGINKYPRLTRSARSNVRIGCIKMPASPDFLIAVIHLLIDVTIAAGLAYRKRQNQLVVAEDFLTLLVNQGNKMNEVGSTAVTFVARRFAIAIGGDRHDQNQQTQNACCYQSFSQLMSNPFFTVLILD